MGRVTDLLFIIEWDLPLCGGTTVHYNKSKPIWRQTFQLGVDDDMQP